MRNVWYMQNDWKRNKGWTIRKLMRGGGRGGQAKCKKICSCKGKSNKKIHAHQLTRKQKFIQGSKIPPPHNFSKRSVPNFNWNACARPCCAIFGANLIEQPLCRSVYYNCTLECRKGQLTVRNKVPREQTFLSCMTFNVNEVVRHGLSLARSWFVSWYAPGETFSPFNPGA